MIPNLVMNTLDRPTRRISLGIPPMNHVAIIVHLCSCPNNLEIGESTDVTEQVGWIRLLYQELTEKHRALL